MSRFERFRQWFGGLGAPPDREDADSADTCASVVLCLREAGYAAEASAYEGAFVRAENVDELDFARLGFPFGESEFEQQFFEKWLRAGGAETQEHEALKQSLAERRREKLGTAAPRNGDEPAS